MNILLDIALMGVIATLAIDVWALFLNKGLGLPVTNWAMVGRWLGHLPEGRFVHNPISETASVTNELILGWVFHYVIGLIYAAIYLLIMLSLLESAPGLLSASVFGIATVIAPWFILQPGLGMGICASNTPRPSLARVLNLLTHTIFGVALYIGWMSAAIFD